MEISNEFKQWINDYPSKNRLTWNDYFIAMAYCFNKSLNSNGILVHDKNIITIVHKNQSLPFSDSYLKECELYLINCPYMHFYWNNAIFKKVCSIQFNPFNYIEINSNNIIQYPINPIIFWISSYPISLTQNTVIFNLSLAYLTSKRSSCFRMHVGAIISRYDINNSFLFLSSGYNGAPTHRIPCSEIGYCYREKNQIRSGTQLEKCRASGSHAELNAIILSAKNGKNINHSQMYLFGHYECCIMCKGAISNSGIMDVYHLTSNNEIKKYHVDSTWLIFNE